MKLLNTSLKAFVLFFIVFAGVFAQDDNTENGGEQNSATINYAIGDLEKMNKLELTQIYIAKLKRLNNIIVYLPFAKLEPQTPNDLKIPATTYNEKAMNNLQKSLTSYNSVVEGSLTTINPYADKRYIIESIIFVQDIINKIELVGLGMIKLGY